MLGFEDASVIEEFADAQVENPMPCKSIANGKMLYLSHNNFGHLRKIGGESPFYTMCPKLVDFGLAQRGDRPNAPLVFPIQADQFQAPEVILGTGWSYSADIWNLGVVVSIRIIGYQWLG
jgi:serine/threonine-protein kinase SRPK3